MYDSVKDSGARQAFATGSVRDTAEGKGRYDLLPAYALHRLARHFENGAKKYGEENWRKGQPLRRFLDSAIRHLFKFLEGYRDEDHAIAAAWNILALVETEEMINRTLLPASLRNLPDYTGPQFTDEEIAGMPLAGALPGAYDGVKMLAPDLEPHHFNGVPLQYSPDLAAFDTLPANLMGTPDPLPLIVYQLKNYPDDPARWRLNGDVIQYLETTESDWQDLVGGPRVFGQWISEDTIKPVDLDACGTSDGVTPLSHAQITAANFINDRPYGGGWIQEGTDVRPSGRIANVVKDAMTWLREN